mmetsp:Transcript_62622/g.198285  ORF Transcript_62622/g.198285 Transcript_62622/m.198285 type:complete len:209 (+) Transcript_62622:391-1017(+)
MAGQVYPGQLRADRVCHHPSLHRGDGPPLPAPSRVPPHVRVPGARGGGPRPRQRVRAALPLGGLLARHCRHRLAGAAECAAAGPHLRGCCPCAAQSAAVHRADRVLPAPARGVLHRGLGTLHGLLGAGRGAGGAAGDGVLDRGELLQCLPSEPLQQPRDQMHLRHHPPGVRQCQGRGSRPHLHPSLWEAGVPDVTGGARGDHQRGDAL